MAPRTPHHNVIDLTGTTSDDELEEMTDVLKNSAIKAERAASRLESQLTMTASNSRDQAKLRSASDSRTSSPHGRGLPNADSDEDSDLLGMHIQSAAKRRLTRRYDAVPQSVPRLSPSIQPVGHICQSIPKISTTILDSGIGESLSESDASRGKEMTDSSDISEGGTSFADATRRVVKEMKTPSRSRRLLQWRKKETHIPRKDSSASLIGSFYQGAETEPIRRSFKSSPKKKLVSSVIAKITSSKTYNSKTSKRGQPNQYQPIDFDGSAGDISLLDAGQEGEFGPKKREISSSQSTDSLLGSTDSLLGARIPQHQIEDPFDSETELGPVSPLKQTNQHSGSTHGADTESVARSRAHLDLIEDPNILSFAVDGSVVNHVPTHSSVREGSSCSSSGDEEEKMRTVFRTQPESSPSISAADGVQLLECLEEDSDSDMGVSIAGKFDTELGPFAAAIDGIRSTRGSATALGASYRRSTPRTTLEDPASPLSSSSFAELTISVPRSQSPLVSSARESGRRGRSYLPLTASALESLRKGWDRDDLSARSKVVLPQSQLMQYEHRHAFTHGHTLTNSYTFTDGNVSFKNDMPSTPRTANETRVQPRLDSTDSGNGSSTQPSITRRGSSRNQQPTSANLPGSSTANDHTTALFSKLAQYMTKEPKREFKGDTQMGGTKDHDRSGTKTQSKRSAKSGAFFDDEISMSDFTWIKGIKIEDPAHNSLNIGGLLLNRRLKGNPGHKKLLNDLDSAASNKWISIMEWKGASSDILYCAWAQDGQKYVLGAAAETDEHSMQYNRNNNLLLGNLSTNTLQELPDHRTPRPPANFSEDPWLYQSVTGVKFSSLQDRMYSSSFDETVKIWDVSSEGPRCIETLYHGACVDLLATSAVYDGVIATGSQKLSGSLRVYHSFGCDSVDEDTNAKYISCSSVRALSKPAWELYPSCLLWGPTKSSANLLLAGYTQYGMLDDSSSPASHGHLCLWNVETETFVTLVPCSQNVMAAAWSREGRYCATGTAASGKLSHPKTTRSVVRVYDPVGGARTMIVEFESPALDMNEIVFHPINANIISAACTDGKVYVWDHRKPEYPLHILKHGESIATLGEELDREQEDTGVQLSIWDKLGKDFYTGSSDGVIKRWDIRRSPEDVLIEDIWTLEAGVMCGEFSPDEKRLLLGDSSGKAYVLEHDLAYARYGPIAFTNPNKGLVKRYTESYSRAAVDGGGSSRVNSTNRRITGTTSLVKDLAGSEKPPSYKFDVPTEKERLYIYSDTAKKEHGHTVIKPKPQPVRFVYANSPAEAAVVEIGGRSDAQTLIKSGQIALHPVLGPVQGPKYKGPYATWARPANTDPAITSLLPSIRATQLSRGERSRGRLHGGEATKMQRKLVKENLDIAANRNIPISLWPTADEQEQSDGADDDEDNDKGFCAECETCTILYHSVNLIYCHGPEIHFFCHQCIKDKAAFEMKQGDYRLKCTWCDSTFDRSQKKAALDRDTFNTLMMKNGRPWGNKHRRNDIGIPAQQEKMARIAWEKAKKEEAESEGGAQVKVKDIVQEEMWKGWKLWRYEQAKKLGKKEKKEEKYMEKAFWWSGWDT